MACLETAPPAKKNARLAAASLELDGTKQHHIITPCLNSCSCAMANGLPAVKICISCVALLYEHVRACACAPGLWVCPGTYRIYSS